MRKIDAKSIDNFVTLDSGVRQEFASGMRRDTQVGKPDYMLVDEPMLTRWAALMTRGAEKYGRENWKLANSQEELDRFMSSAYRHFIQWTRGDLDEDHAAACFFNISAAEHTKREISKQTNVDLHVADL